jgi:hypothetical protein
VKGNCHDDVATGSLAFPAQVWRLLRGDRRWAGTQVMATSSAAWWPPVPGAFRIKEKGSEKDD